VHPGPQRRVRVVATFPDLVLDTHATLWTGVHAQ
jgi:hypothetical protein